MNSAKKHPEIEAAYKLFGIVRDSPYLASRIARHIEFLAQKLHPSDVREKGTFSFSGAQFAVDVSDRFGRAYYYNFDQEQQDLAVFTELCTPDSIVWDIGANFGLYTVLCARKLNTQGMLMAVEPHRRALALLKNNIAANNLFDRVRVFEDAASNEDGQAVFFESSETAFSGLTNTGRAAIENTLFVDTTRVDTLWKKTGCRHIDLMKIDVEGHEGAVLEGSIEALTASPHAIVQFELSPKNLTSGLTSQLHSALLALHAKGWALYPSLNAQELAVVALDALLTSPENYSGNIFMVRSGSGREKELLRTYQSFLQNTRAAQFTKQEMLDALEPIFRQHDLELENARHQNTPQNTPHKPGIRVNTFAPHVQAFRGENNCSFLRTPRELSAAELAQVKDFTIVLRACQNDFDTPRIKIQLSEMCGSIPYSIVATDARSFPDHEINFSRITRHATLIAPPSGDPNRYTKAFRAALATATASHIIILDAKNLPNRGAITSAMHIWQQKALKERILVGGVAFPIITADSDGPYLEETLGGMLTVRYGIFSREAIEVVGLPDDTLYTGDGFDRDLSLRIWHGGFSIIEASTESAVNVSNCPEFSLKDTEALEQQWQGIFTHRAIPELFKKPGLRRARDN